MEKINAIGDVCPVPVIKTKKALRTTDVVEIVVDNEIATQNLKKMAEQLGYGYSMNQVSTKEYTVVIDKNKADDEVCMPMTHVEVNEVKGESYSVFCDTQVMGRGDDVLGTTLMKGFFYALTEQDVLPDKVVLYNGGVHLAVEGSDVLEDLQTLLDKGVEVYACGACANFYGVTDQIKLAEITNMYRIVELMREANRVVKP